MGAECRPLPKVRSWVALGQTEEGNAFVALLVQIDRRASGEARP